MLGVFTYFHLEHFVIYIISPFLSGSNNFVFHILYIHMYLAKGQVPFERLESNENDFQYCFSLRHLQFCLFNSLCRYKTLRHYAYTDCHGNNIYLIKFSNHSTVPIIYHIKFISKEFCDLLFCLREDAD